ncbi:granzyme B-like [Denticeps clupeoides]|uniref:Peptidase S1 domain-containing protein n=1 Tax=Denticeps clupeoides TaxID=299321 RepID=A0AAY4CDL1_9TELE|nr:granzyme B-like [Denticeps clupeoides]
MHVLQHLLLLTATMALGDTGQIIHGKKAQSNSWQFMASVQDNGKHKCGGFLIDPSFVLTAAHCDNRSKNLTVILGTHSLKKQGTRYQVQLKIIHESYEKANKGHDIMLLKLSRKVRTSKTVKTVEFPKKDTVMKLPAQCQVAGWGLKETRGEKSEDLLVANVTVIDPKVCKKEWSDVNVKLPKNVICAGGYDTTKGACQGDSGGPLVFRKMAVGIVSFNLHNNCDYPNAPNIYTDISKYASWITKNIKMNS